MSACARLRADTHSVVRACRTKATRTYDLGTEAAGVRAQVQPALRRLGFEGSRASELADSAVECLTTAPSEVVLDFQSALQQVPLFLCSGKA
jgi:hypothetical protein